MLQGTVEHHTHAINAAVRHSQASDTRLDDKLRCRILGAHANTSFIEGSKSRDRVEQRRTNQPFRSFMDMDQVAVFSGLGSSALFSDKHIARITSDALTPAGQILLSSCYEVFVEEVQLMNDSTTTEQFGFRGPDDLINPAPVYQQNGIIQHSTLCLGHLLRYLHLNYTTSPKDVAYGHVTGLCAGLLPAVAAATSSNLVGFLKQARQVYRFALLVGIASEKHLAASSLKAGVIHVDSMLLSELTALVEQHLKHTARTQTPLEGRMGC